MNYSSKEFHVFSTYCRSNVMPRPCQSMGRPLQEREEGVNVANKRTFTKIPCNQNMKSVNDISLRTMKICSINDTCHQCSPEHSCIPGDINISGGFQAFLALSRSLLFLCVSFNCFFLSLLFLLLYACYVVVTRAAPSA